MSNTDPKIMHRDNPGALRGSVETNTRDYFEWDRNPTNVAARWSTTLPVGEFLVRSNFVVTGQDTISPNGTGMLRGRDRNARRVSSQEIAQAIEDQPEDITFARLNYEGIAVIWTPPPAKSTRGLFAGPEGAAIIAPRRTEELGRVVEETTSGQLIAQLALELTSDLKPADRA